MRKKRLISIMCVFMFVMSVLSAMYYLGMPDRIILYKDKEWANGNIVRLTNLDDSLEVSKETIVPRKVGDYEAAASIFGIPYKSVQLTVLEEQEVILGGQTVGIRLYSDGLVVIALGRVSENKKSPAEEAGIKIGDIIKKVNGEKVGNPDNFSKIIDNSQGELTLLVERDGEEIEIKLTAELSDYDNIKRIGLWVRDSTAGIGTITYMSDKTMTYGALGHGISDSDTSVRFPVLKGSIEKCGVSQIIKGEKGSPGELKGVFYTKNKAFGDIQKNVDVGIFGNITEIQNGERVKVALKGEIQKGKASIRTSLDGENVEEYEIEILRVAPNSKNVLKGLVIKVTDEELLEKTGGIVQGMSGSPIIQNGKLIGAVTHVLVNDPTKGYGVFIENMLLEAEKSSQDNS
ncbi:MAG: SpoIVB peptidase [Clostridia bacterium]